jgi:hypothetical protein
MVVGQSSVATADAADTAPVGVIGKHEIQGSHAERSSKRSARKNNHLGRLRQQTDVECDTPATYVRPVDRYPIR